MSIKILYKDLWTYRSTNPKNKEPLSMLNGKDYSHIHGELQLVINGELVPRLGFRKNKEVCFNYWIKELAQVISAFKNKKHEYTILGWDQGLPSFRFEKVGKKGFVSIVDFPELSAKGDSNWCKREFAIQDLYIAYSEFKDKFLKDIEGYAPDVLKIWQSIFDYRVEWIHY